MRYVRVEPDAVTLRLVSDRMPLRVPHAPPSAVGTVVVELAGDVRIDDVPEGDVGKFALGLLPQCARRSGAHAATDQALMVAVKKSRAAVER